MFVALGRIWLMVALCGLFLACGEDEAEFDACGGDLVGEWNFESVSLEPSDPDCTGMSPTISGYVFFNADGRFTPTVETTGWKKPGGDGSCAFQTSYGGFYRVQGSWVCMATSMSDLSAMPCDGSGPVMGDAASAEAEFCVEPSGLKLRSKSFLYVPAAAIFELTPRQ